eukprot:8282950-Pyramimonas_sp.AAC.1
MRPKTGKGIDQLTVGDLARLPDAALQELADLYTAAERAATWPEQLLLVLGHVLEKKGGGERIIG